MAGSLPTGEPFALSITEASKLLSIGRTSLYQLIKSEKIKERKIGRRTIFLRDELEHALKSLPCAGRGA
jgi:excisionase family DNA binding protein